MTRRKTSRTRRQSGGLGLQGFGALLDIMLHDDDVGTIVGPDFILKKNDPYNADIGHLEPEALRTYDQTFVDKLISLKADKEIDLTVDLAGTLRDYEKQRDALTEYHCEVMEGLLLNYGIESAKELGNFGTYINKIVLRNEAETNLFYDYLALYRQLNKKRTITQWRSEHPKLITKANEKVATAYENATFAVLRLDKMLNHGATLTTNILTKEQCILMDKALNLTLTAGNFFICASLDMGGYIMTGGCGVPISTDSELGKSILTLLKKHLTKLRSAKRPINKNIMDCAREVIGFCLRSGVMECMTIR